MTDAGLPGLAAVGTAVPGLTLRRFRSHDDFRVLNAVANAARAAEGFGFQTSDEQFRNFYEHLSNSDLLRDLLIAELDGRVVGYARTSWGDEPGGLRVYEVVAFVAFVERGDTGGDVLAVLLDAAEQRVGELAREHGPRRKVLRTNGSDGGPERETELHRRGYRPVRHEYVMERPSLDPLEDAPMPAGLEVRPVRPEDLPRIWEAETEAFRDAWGFTEPTEADFERFATDPVEGDTSLWVVAWDGDEVAGMVRNYINADENEESARRRGWVEHISVGRRWRRRGLARAMIDRSFAVLRERGMSEAALGVDTENESGALRLYESCGFRPVARLSVFERLVHA